LTIAWSGGAGASEAARSELLIHPSGGGTGSGLELVIIQSEVRVGRCVAVSAPPRHRATGIALPPKAAFLPALPAGIGKAINASVPRNSC
jgi:hypothetical protein